MNFCSFNGPMERRLGESGPAVKQGSERAGASEIWRRVGAALIRALRDYPEAREAALKGLEEEFGSDEAQ